MGAADQRAARNMSPWTAGKQARALNAALYAGGERERMTGKKTSKWHASVFTGPLNASRGEGVLDFTWDV